MGRTISRSELIHRINKILENERERDRLKKGGDRNWEKMSAVRIAQTN
jgi:hypothetical protein